MSYLIRPIERHLKRDLATDRDRQRFERAKRFVDETIGRRADPETTYRLNARWLKFLCRHAAVQRQLWPRELEFLERFTHDFALPPAERRKFLALTTLGRLWRSVAFADLMKAPDLLVRLTEVAGWEHFERCRRSGSGLILLPVHGQFARLFRPYLRHRGHDGLEVGLPTHKLEKQGLHTPAAKGFELARQMQAAKQLLIRGGMAFNLPDAFQNLDHSRSVPFFGRERRIAAGFAELALKTEAHVIPLAFRFTPRGSFVLEFATPLQVPSPQASHAVRVDTLVGQFADFLRAEWLRHPWNIPWHHLAQYCMLPGSDSRSSQEDPDALRA